MFLFWNKLFRKVLFLSFYSLFVGYGTASAEVTVNGFATIGLTNSNTNDLIYRNGLNRWPEKSPTLLTDSLIGIQLNYQVNNKVDIVAQSILENKVYETVSDYIELAFIRYQLNRNYSVRFGRINHNAYIISEYQDVGYSYLWAAPPTEFYSISSFISYIDGIELEYRNSVYDGMLQATFSVGRNKSKPVDVDSVSLLEHDLMVNSSVTYETDHWLLKASVSYLRGDKLKIDKVEALAAAIDSFPALVWPAKTEIVKDLSFEQQNRRYYSLGASYNNKGWVVKSELAYFNVNIDVLGDLGYGYVSIGYEFDKITPYFTFAIVDALSDRQVIDSPNYNFVTDPAARQALSSLETGAQAFYDSSRLDQHSLSAGFRWDIIQNWALKGQLSRYTINGPGYPLWGATTLQVIPEHRNVNVFSLNLSTIF